MTNGIVVIKKGREKPIINQHPWIFSGAIARVENAAPGSIVTVVSHKDEFLARGYWNANSQIQVRILTWQDEDIDENWWQSQIERAINTRKQHYGNNTNAYRLINAENDFIPGLIVDQYADVLVMQCLTLGIDQRKEMLFNLLADQIKPRSIYERSDVDVRRKEGLAPSQGLLWGEEVTDTITVINHGIHHKVNILTGHKTGTYLDQQENHRILHRLVADAYEGANCNILNMFSYTGLFGIHAQTVDSVHITNVDASEDALNLAEENAVLNGFSPDNMELILADAFEYLHDCVDEGKEYHIIVLDPPKFAHNKQQVDKAARGYKDLNLNAFKIIKSGGYLMTFSCSGAISRDLFQKIVFGALADSGRQAQIIAHLSASQDHPIAITFPEGEYLKGLLLKVF